MKGLHGRVGDFARGLAATLDYLRRFSQPLELIDL
jgi:hypothetical protein